MKEVNSLVMQKTNVNLMRLIKKLKSNVEYCNE